MKNDVSIVDQEPSSEESGQDEMLVQLLQRPNPFIVVAKGEIVQ
jgi:hypothetical protein